MAIIFVGNEVSGKKMMNVFLNLLKKNDSWQLWPEKVYKHKNIQTLIKTVTN